MASKKNTMELEATIAWKAWGHAWSMFTRCAGCDEMKQCRGARRSRMLCLDCFDQKEGK